MKSQGGAKNDLPPLDGPNPSGYTCYSPEEISTIADYKKQCDVNELDLRLMNREFKKCVAANACEKTVTDTSTFFWASVAGGFLFGFIAGSAR